MSGHDVLTKRNVIITVEKPAARDLSRWLAPVCCPSVLMGQPRFPDGVRTMEHGYKSPLQIDVSWDGVSCPLAADCTAVSEAGAGGGGTTFAEGWAKGEWVLEHTRNPADAKLAPS